MRLWFGAALLLIALVPGSQANARSGPSYCAVSRGHEMAYENCGFATFEACLEELKGMRGYCRVDQYLAPPAVRESRPAKERRRPQQ